MLGNDAMWYWFTAALALGILECFVDGYFVLGFAAACFVFGVLSNFPSVYHELEPAHFLALSAPLVLAFYVFGNRLFWGGRARGPESSLGLTSRDRIVGEVGVVCRAISGGKGAVEARGTVWKCTGEDAPVGARVVVADILGNTLLVKRLEES
ncbi:MAG: NfeD family protein [Rhodospirillaceae bacterium]